MHFLGWTIRQQPMSHTIPDTYSRLLSDFLSAPVGVMLSVSFLDKGAYDILHPST